MSLFVFLSNSKNTNNFSNLIFLNHFKVFMREKSISLSIHFIIYLKNLFNIYFKEVKTNF